MLCRRCHVAAPGGNASSFSVPSTSSSGRARPFQRKIVHVAALVAKPTLYPSPRVCTAPLGTAVVYNRWSSVVPYQEAWDFQREQASRYAEAQIDGLETDRVILLQHEPVYTLGTGSTEDHLKFDIDNPKLPTFRTERGGEVTYHGPGQLVMYPILNLRNHKQDLHWYMRRLEDVVIRALHEVSGLRGERVAGLTGVWVDGHKVAAIGVRATRWITYHGLALNVTNSLEPFSDIVPCGISDRPVTSVLRALGVEKEVTREQEDALLEEYSVALLDAFSEVFKLELLQDL